MPGEEKPPAPLEDPPISQAWGEGSLGTSSRPHSASFHGHHSKAHQRWLEQGRLLIIPSEEPQNPLFEGFENRERERASASARIVTQGSMAYLHADEFSYPVERFIPIDIYSEDWEPHEVIDVATALNALLVALGFGVLAYPV